MGEYDDRTEHERVEDTKREVGMAEPGTDEYYSNARRVLSQYDHPNEETQEKLDWLRKHNF